MRMSGAGWFVVAVALVFQSGCRSSDIERTLVTVDVTGVWEGSVVYSTVSHQIVLVLQQEGQRVTGRRTQVGGNVGSVPSRDVAIEGTVNGDTFSFHDVNEVVIMNVNLIVSGDEMGGTGQPVGKWYFRRRPQ